MVGLTFDGTHLGAYEFTTALSSWWMPCSAETSGRKSVVIYTYLKLLQKDGTIVRYPIVLKRNTQKRTDQALIDEMKPLFGLQKMGTHRIRLHGVIRKIYDQYPWIVHTAHGIFRNGRIHKEWSEYLIFKATCSEVRVHASTSNGNQVFTDFVPLPTLSRVAYYPFLTQNVKEGQKKFYQELQKIFVFRDLFRINSTNTDDILVKFHTMASEEFKTRFRETITQQNYADPHDNDNLKINLIPLVSEYTDETPSDRLVPLSIDEMKMKLLTEKYTGLSEKVRSYCLQKSDIHAKALINMIGLTAEDYATKIEILRNSMNRIVQRIDREHLWIVDKVISDIMNKVSIYYSVMVQ